MAQRAVLPGRVFRFFGSYFAKRGSCAVSHAALNGDPRIGTRNSNSGTGGLVDWRTGTGTGSLDYAKERGAHQAIECSESCSCNAATRRMRNARVKALNQSARELETLLSATRMASQLAVIRVWFGFGMAKWQT